MTAKLKVAIIGAGMGGLAAAAILARMGIDADVYEQATEFTRIGSGIQMSPNAMRYCGRSGWRPSYAKSRSAPSISSAVTGTPATSISTIRSATPPSSATARPIC